MKQYITPEDLSGLSDSQKINLRDIWMPAVNTLACASICTDVINDEFETFVFVIGGIILHEGSTNPILRRFSLVDEDIITEDDNGEADGEFAGELPNGDDDDQFDVLFDEMDDEDDINDDFDEEDINDDFDEDDEFDFNYSEPDQYFGKADCLPLLSIGQMIEMLNSLKFGNDGFHISIPSSKRLIGDPGCTVTNRVELEYEEEELCDALWSALKEHL